MLPELVTPIPGPRSQELAARLSAVECRNTTSVAEDWPIFWERAEGSNVWDADGNRYLDLTSAFGVATLGHSYSSNAARAQAEHLLHAMGDVHPAAVKVELCEALSAITYERWSGEKGKALLGNSGFEAVEAALKTAVLATGKPGIVAFQNAYHGLGYGALLGTGIQWFREPFQTQLAQITWQLPFPTDNLTMGDFRAALDQVDSSWVGAVLVEPFQCRGGIQMPPPSLLQELRDWCDRNGALLIVDEIFTGFHRTGKMFACEHSNVVPDLICLGKALAGGYPISACVGRAAIMDAWPETAGEALHTSTFLGNPVGCAMALACLKEYMSSSVAERVASLSVTLRKKLVPLVDSPFVREIRGNGLMKGIELLHHGEAPAGDVAFAVAKALLRDGILIMPEGPYGNILAFTPPLTLTEEELIHAVSRIQHHLREFLTETTRVHLLQKQAEAVVEVEEEEEEVDDNGWR